MHMTFLSDDPKIIIFSTNYGNIFQKKQVSYSSRQDLTDITD